MNDLNVTVTALILLAMVIFTLGAVMIRNLVKATICLALVSVVLTILMFLLVSPLAAVFELSVCAGLITVVFISAISLTKPSTCEELKLKIKERRKRFAILPILVVIIGVALWLIWPNINIAELHKLDTINTTVQETIWNLRQVDVLGLIVIILAGVFGIVVLFKDKEREVK